MAVDSPIPLASADDLVQGALADLARSAAPDYLDRVMIRATRACETEANRRLAPFTMTETHRAHGVDPDEFSGGSALPLDLVGTVGRSYAYALGSANLVRHCWLREYAVRYPEMWQYSDVSIRIERSYGGSEQLALSGYQGPEPDTGHVWFNLGKFIPVGSQIKVTYSGGYRVSIPSDLEQACIYMAAGILCRDLDPMNAQTGRSPEALEALAVSWLQPYMRT